MFKQLIFSALSLLTIVSAVSLYSDSASAQDFYHRDSRERRRGDWGRGYGDGAECTRQAMEVADAICEITRTGRPTHAPSCHDAAYTAAQSPGMFLEQVSRDRNGRYGRAISLLAQRVSECRGNREAAFDRDVERDSNNWHEQEERREREARRQQEGTGQQSGPSDDDSDF